MIAYLYILGFRFMYDVNVSMVRVIAILLIVCAIGKTASVFFTLSSGSASVSYSVTNLQSSCTNSSTKSADAQRAVQFIPTCLNSAKVDRELEKS